MWWRKGAESARPASAGKSIEDMTRLTSQREGDHPLARPSSVSRARYSKVLDAEEKRLKAELVRAEYQATQDRGNESATSLNNLVRDRREEAKRERAEANERARQLRMSVAADGATARQQVAARNELSRLRKMEFAKEARERVQSSASSLAEGRDALRKSKAEEERRKATKVYAEMQGRQARAAKQAAQTERELEEKRERVARIRGETDPRGAILENRELFERNKREVADRIRQDEKGWVQQTEHARQMLRSETQAKHDKVFKESGGSVSIAWKKRCAPEQGQARKPWLDGFGSDRPGWFDSRVCCYTG